ncbi:NUDIX domain-containing protein [Ectothiorhodospiraceae bacterium BW-2]|nr:NUDIX domain-containing protein [Ectothiorhodospiraceae bacterium BW-2]
MQPKESIAQPVVAVGAFVIHNGAILLVKRGRPPAAGEWAVPGGRLQWGESLQQGAEREVWEECGVTICAKEVIYHFENRVSDGLGGYLYHYVVLDMVADYLGGEPQAGDDAAEVAWFELTQLPSVALNRQTALALQQLGWWRGELRG